jgi:hypothetical protein
MVVYLQPFFIIYNDIFCSRDLKWHSKSENKRLDDTL